MIFVLKIIASNTKIMTLSSYDEIVQRTPISSNIKKIRKLSEYNKIYLIRKIIAQNFATRLPFLNSVNIM